jgi:hypothetical protein
MQSTIASISARREVLPGPALGVLGVAFEQTLVGVALDIGVEREPALVVDQVPDEAGELGGVLDLVLGLLEDDAEHARLLAERFEDVAVLGFELGAIEADEAGPVAVTRYERLLVVGRFGPLVGHFEEEQEGELLDVVAVGEAVVAEQVAVVPELLDNLLAMRAGH